MKERPILFSAPMVRAILAGRKTQTRQVVKGLQFVEYTAPGISPYWRLLFATCTVATHNQAQKRVLTRAGWKRVAMFNNSRTGESTEVWGYEVRKS